MAKLNKPKGLTIGEVRDISTGKSNRKLTPEEKIQVKKFDETTRKFIENLKLPNPSDIKLPHLGDLIPDMSTYAFKLPDVDIASIGKDYEAEAVQKALNRELLEELRAGKQQSKALNPVFDVDSGNIHFAGKVIKISIETSQYAVCKVIFSKAKKIWDFEEIAEKRKDYHDDAKRHIYDAVRQINLKIASKTTIKDLLLLTTKSVTVNPSYLL